MNDAIELNDCLLFLLPGWALSSLQSPSSTYANTSMSKHLATSPSPPPPPPSSPPSLSLFSSPLFDQALAALPLSSPSLADARYPANGRSSTDIVTRQLEDEGGGEFEYFGIPEQEDGEVTRGDIPWTTGFTGIPTGIPLTSPEQLPHPAPPVPRTTLLDRPTAVAVTARPVSQTTCTGGVGDGGGGEGRGGVESQETTSSTDTLDKEFKSGEELIIAHAHAELESGLTAAGRSGGSGSGSGSTVMTMGREKRKRSTSTSITPPPPPPPTTLFLHPSHQIHKDASSLQKPRHGQPVVVLPIDVAPSANDNVNDDNHDNDDDCDRDGDAGDTGDPWTYTEDSAYAASKFGGIGEYMRHKRIKL